MTRDDLDMVRISPGAAQSRRVARRFVTFLGITAVLLATHSTARGQATDERPATAVIQERLTKREEEIHRLKAQLAGLESQKSDRAPGPETPPPPAADSAAAPSETKPQPAADFLGSLGFRASVDGYYSYDFNRPDSRRSSFRAFDGPANQFSLNLAQFTLEKTPEPTNGRLGFRLSTGFGNAMNAMNGSESSFAQYLYEAYGSYLVPVGKGLLVDFGKFVTPHGAEVIDTQDNWNYSRGLLFSYAIPFYHFGVRAKYSFNDQYWLSGYLVNGWNNVVDNNTGKTIGVGLGWNPSKKLSVVQNYMAGPEQPGNNTGWRQLIDTLVTITPTERWSFMVNYDYGRGDRVSGLPGPVWWTGVAGYVRYAPSRRHALAVRYEYYNDHDGFTTGTAQHLHGVTGTFERRIAKNLITRLEFRRDLSNCPSFTRGDVPARAQSVVLGGIIYSFDAREK